MCLWDFHNTLKWKSQEALMMHLCKIWSRGGSVSIMTEVRAGRSGFHSWNGCRGFLLFADTSTPALEPSQPPVQWIQENLSPGIKRPVCEADKSPPSSTEVKNAWSYTSTPLCLHGAVFN
jgi:hypothetical protein